MKLFVPLTDAFIVPAQAIILQILFSKTIEDFCTEGIACQEQDTRKEGCPQTRQGVFGLCIHIHIHTYIHVYIYIHIIVCKACEQIFRVCTQYK